MMTVQFVADMLTGNRFRHTRFTCPDGVDVTITPCFYGGEIADISECEYFLVDGDLPWLGGPSLEKVVADLNRHAELVASADAEKIELRKFFDEHQAHGWDDDSWGWYSDWHKDVYGFRPHGRVCGEYVSPY